MYKTYNTQADSCKGKMGQLIAATVLFLLMVLVFEARAQEGSQGNATVFAGAQSTFFGNHDFAMPSATPGTQVGIIGTERMTSSIGTGYGVVNYAAASLSVTGANDANHIDGYVRNLGAGLFVYPVGDNGFYGPFAATGAGTTGAYFHADPNVAVTSNLAGGNYPLPLPTGAPFSTASKAADVTTVSTVEYWDIDGAAASKITLTWDLGSAIGTLTGSNLGKLGIVGWDGSKWVNIAATVDPTSVLTGASGLSAGSITTNAAIIPNAYTAYTLAAIVAGIPNLTPTIDIDELSFVTGANRDFVVNVFEINGFAATGSIQVRIAKLSGFTITYPTASGSSNVFGGTPNENSNWTFTENTGFITATAKTGVSIAANGMAVLGFHVARKAATPANTIQYVSPTIVGGSGGETKTDDNGAIAALTAVQ